MIIRDAKPTDVPAITAIHNDAVVNTAAIWTDSRTDDANRTIWLADRTKAGYPVLVAIDDAGDVLGYASFADWHARDGYRYTVEHSVYVRADQRGRGLGKALMTDLIGRARDSGKHVMIAAIEAQNSASVRLHQAFGFQVVGQLPEVGIKFGRWLDLTFMQLILDSKSAVDR